MPSRRSAIAYAVYHSRFGTGLFAIHDDEEVAEVMGVPTYRFKLAAFALSCALAGVAGGIYALFVSYVTVGETFSGWIALYVILMAALGGTRHWLGRRSAPPRSPPSSTSSPPATTPWPGARRWA